MTLHVPDFDYFVLSCRQHPVSVERLQCALNGHPNPQHVIDKYQAQPDFKEFFQGCDPVTAGFFFRELAVGRTLPDTYREFWFWMDEQGIDLAAWVELSFDEKQAMICHWTETKAPVPIPRFPDVWK